MAPDDPKVAPNQLGSFQALLNAKVQSSAILIRSRFGAGFNVNAAFVVPPSFSPLPGYKHL